MRLLYIYIVIIFSLTFASLGQTPYVSTPLMPAKDRVPGYFGVLIGLGQNFQSGEFYVDCSDCIFESGVGTGFTIGAAYDRVALPWLKYGIAGFYDYSALSSTFRENEIIPFELENSGIRENINVQFRHTADLNIHNLTAMPYIKMEPFSFMFFRLGFGASYIFSSSLKHDKELLQKEATLSNGAVVTIRIPGRTGYRVNVQDSEIRQLNNLVLSLMPALGFKINFSETTYLMPYLQYNVPFNDISDEGQNFRLNQWRFFIELGFKLH
ncbi:MAG: hypothetical protein KIT33_12860 [Candidatus Kapabacteria bacterium]|nr:hypothetical protein [Ignavibacteriota bacterium]MCW5885852.1 hypothetical protein [Candidatus Kapabacteria bacterium]